MNGGNTKITFPLSKILPRLKQRQAMKDIWNRPQKQMIDMVKKNTEFIEKLFEIDDAAEDGVYCVAPTEEDLKVFAEHARKRREAKNNK